jgi:regulator of protease activity HflC (stomatin/prohibitin superfamily)
MIDDSGFKPVGPHVIGDKGAFSFPKIPGHFATVAVLAGIAGLIVLVMFATCFSYVRPYELGIKETKLGVHRGIQEKVYTPGWAFLMPFGFERMHVFPHNIQTLELTGFPTEGSKKGKNRFSDKAAKIQTSDGFYVDVDVTILYKIVDPYKLIVTLGADTLYLSNGLMPKAEPILKQAFGELTTEDFYNSPMRTEKAEKARDLLNAELSQNGLKIDHVLVRYFKYSDEIQKNIEAKKLQDQLVFKNQAEAKEATEEANVKRISQEGAMLVAVTMQEGEAYVTTKTGEMDLYTRQKKAEGDLLLKLAEAKRSELKNEAM